MKTYDQVLSAYSGRNGSCCCGCSGTHYYKTELQEEASANRGYLVRKEELNNRMVKRIFNIVNKSPKDYEEDDFVSAVVGKRLYIIYFRKTAVCKT